MTHFLVVASDKSSLALYDSLAISGIIYGFVYQLNSSFCHDMMPLKRMTTFLSKSDFASLTFLQKPKQYVSAFAVLLRLLEPIVNFISN